MKKFVLSTGTKEEVINITEIVQKELENQNIENGVCNLFVLHTTCCLTTADLDPGTDKDLLDSMRLMLPKIQYRHPHDPSHTPDHIISSIIGSSILIPFENKKLLLGTWQQIVLIELDGPRERNLITSFLQTA